MCQCLGMRAGSWSCVLSPPAASPGHGAAGIFALVSVIIGIYQSKLMAAGDKGAYVMYGFMWGA